MIKNALVVNKESVLNIPSTEIKDNVLLISQLSEIGIFDLEYNLANRAYCETDSTVLQLLPYITLIDPTTNKVYTYKRGNKGNEARLVDNYSIGLGGHIEEAPNVFCSIKEVIIANILRELNEEVGLPVSGELLGQLRLILDNNDYTIMYAATDEVGKYHLCLWIILPVSQDMLGASEAEVIVEGRWLSVSELNELNKSNIARLEGWSAHLLEFLALDLI